MGEIIRADYRFSKQSLLIRLISNVRKSNHSGDTFREDDPEEKLATTLYHEVFSGTPYERSILGSKDTIAHLKRENFIYHQEYFYHPSNLTLVVCGDLPENQLFEKIDQFYKNGGKPLQNLFSSFPPLPKVQRKKNRNQHGHTPSLWSYWFFGTRNSAR